MDIATVCAASFFLLVLFFTIFMAGRSHGMIAGQKMLLGQHKSLIVLKTEKNGEKKWKQTNCIGGFEPLGQDTAAIAQIVKSLER